MTKSEVVELVAVLMASYPNNRFPDATVVAYETFLQDLELGRAKQAVERLVKTSKFMPAIAEVIATYDALAPRPPRQLREWIPDPSPGDYRPANIGDSVQHALQLAGKGPKS